MPDPTREQFDAAARKVTETAPPGLSREDFFALVDQELARAGPASFDPAGPDSLAGNKLRGFRTISDSPSEPDWKSDLNAAMQGPAHPQGLSDLVPLAIPGAISGAISGAKNIAGQVRLAGGTGVIGKARSILGRLFDPAAETVEQSVSPQGVARPRGPYQPGGSRPVTREPSPAPPPPPRRPPAARGQPATGGDPVAPVNHGPHPTPPRQTPQAPPSAPSRTFDDLLASELDAEMARPVTAPAGTTPPGPTVTPGGRPSVSPSQYDEIVGSAKETPAAPSPLEQQLRDSLAERGVSDATRLRQEYGSRDAASILGDTKANVKTATGPSVSALPEGARARIDAFLDTHPSPAAVKAWLQRGRGGVPLADAYTASKLKGQGLSDAAIADLLKR